MNDSLLNRLVNSIDQRRFDTILKRCSNMEKKFRVPGFANIEKVPRGYLLNEVKRNKAAELLLLDSIEQEFVKQEDRMDIEIETVDTVRQCITETNKQGVIAHCLINGTDEYIELAESLMDEVETMESEESSDKNQSETTKSKNDKKEESFREKYLQAQKDIRVLNDNNKQLSNENAALNDSLIQSTNTINQKDNEIKDLKTIIEQEKRTTQEIQQKRTDDIQTIKERDIQIVELNQTIEKLRERIGYLEKEINTLSPRKKYLVVGCESTEIPEMKNGDVSNGIFSDKETLQSILSGCDELWAVMGSVNLSRRLIIKNYKEEQKEKIRQFGNIDELFDYIDTI